jgi:adenylate kinase family enzyme
MPTVVMAGPPSSGKTTQCDMLHEFLNNSNIKCEQLSVTQLIHDKQDQIPIIKELRMKGKLKTQLSTQITQQILEDHLRTCTSEVILFYRGPSTVEEALIFPKIDLLIVLEMKDREEMIQRVCMRRVDQQTGKTYHLIKDSAEIDRLGILDRLTCRFGDDRELFERRLDRHEQRMAPIIEHYRDITEVKFVDAQRDIEQVFADVRDLVLCEIEKQRSE